MNSYLGHATMARLDVDQAEADKTRNLSKIQSNEKIVRYKGKIVKPFGSSLGPSIQLG